MTEQWNNGMKEQKDRYEFKGMNEWKTERMSERMRERRNKGRNERSGRMNEQTTFILPNVT